MVIATDRRIMGVDPAGTEEDRSVIALWDGKKLTMVDLNLLLKDTDREVSVTGRYPFPLPSGEILEAMKICSVEMDHADLERRMFSSLHTTHRAVVTRSIFDAIFAPHEFEDQRLMAEKYIRAQKRLRDGV